MNRARVQAVSALAAAFVLTIIAVVWLSSSSGSGGDDGSRRSREDSDPLTRALRYVPRSAPAVAAIQTDTGDGPLRDALARLSDLSGADDVGTALDELVKDRTGLSLADDLASVGGAPLVLAVSGPAGSRTLLGAVVVPDAATLTSVLQSHVSDGSLQDAGGYRRATLYRQDDGEATIAQDDGLLLVGSTKAAVRAALDRGVRRGAAAATGFTRDAFSAQATSGIPANDAVVRIALSGAEIRRLVARRLPDADQLPWLAAIDGAGVGVRVDDGGAHLRVRIRTDESSLADSDLPLAAGTSPPEVVGDAALRVGLRDVAQTVGFALRSIRLLTPERLASYDKARALVAQYTRVDPEDDILTTLTGPATISVASDGSGITLRAQTRDEENVQEGLDKLAHSGGVGQFATALGLGDVADELAIQDDESGDGTYELTRSDEPIARFGLLGDTLVVTTDTSSDLADLADAPADPAEGGVKGALHADLTGAALVDLLGERLGLSELASTLLGDLGPTTVTARAALGGLTLAVDAKPAG